MSQRTTMEQEEITIDVLERIADIIRQKCKTTNRAFLNSITAGDIAIQKVNRNACGVIVTCTCVLKQLYTCFVCAVEGSESISFN